MLVIFVPYVLWSPCLVAMCCALLISLMRACACVLNICSVFHVRHVRAYVHAYVVAFLYIICVLSLCIH